MDRINMSLDDVVKMSNTVNKTAKRAPKKVVKKKVVKSSSSSSKMSSSGSGNARGGKLARPERTLRQPTPQQLSWNASKVAPDSVLSRLGPKQENGCAVIISNLNFNISQGDVRELCTTVGEVGKIFVHPGSGRADVWFLNKRDGLRCVQRYNRVTLDGRPMRASLKEDHDKEAANKTGGVFGSERHPFGGGRGASQRDPTFGRHEQPRVNGNASASGNGRGGQTTFSVTMSGVAPSKNEMRKAAVPYVPIQKKLKLKGSAGNTGNTKNEKKDRAPRAPKPVKEKTVAPTSEAMDDDMDAYFSARSAAKDE